MDWSKDFDVRGGGGTNPQAVFDWMDSNFSYLTTKTKGTIQGSVEVNPKIYQMLNLDGI